MDVSRFLSRLLSPPAKVCEPPLTVQILVSGRPLQVSLLRMEAQISSVVSMHGQHPLKHANPPFSRPSVTNLGCARCCACAFLAAGHPTHAFQWCNMVCVAVPQHLSPCLTWRAVHSHTEPAVFAPSLYFVMVLSCSRLVCQI